MKKCIGLMTLVASIACFACCSRVDYRVDQAKGFKMESTGDGSLEKELAHWEATGKLGTLTFEFWVGGGLPPPYYRSEQLRLFSSDDASTIEFAKVIWDARFDPQNLHAKWTLTARPADVQAVARLLRESQLLRVEYPEQKKGQTADQISYEIILSVGDHQEKRVYFGRLPAALQPLKNEVDRLIRSATEEGGYSVYHQGRRIK